MKPQDMNNNKMNTHFGLFYLPFESASFDSSGIVGSTGVVSLISLSMPRLMRSSRVLRTEICRSISKYNHNLIGTSYFNLEVSPHL